MKLLKVIIVEDSEDDSILLLHELKKGGFDPDHIRVETAEALSAALEEGGWQLVISDHALPTFSAPEALAILNSSGHDLPFIIVSSVIGEDVAVAAMKAGADDFIMKSNLTRLVAVVERALADSWARAEREKTRKTLQQSEERFRRLAENAKDLVFRLRVAPEQKFEYVSPSATSIIGFTPEEHYSNPKLGEEIVYPDDYWMLSALQKGDLELDKPLVIRWIHKNGSIIWVEQHLVPVCDANGSLIAYEGIARDITDRVIKEDELKKSHAQIEALSGRVLTAMEEERARLARELHDELGQALTAVKLDLQLLNDQLSCTNDHEKNLNQSIELIDHTINLVRRQSVSLRPPQLDDMGLLPALKDMVTGYSKRTGIDVKLDLNGFSDRFPGHFETALYRCIQESLTNVARHACAKKVAVKISSNNKVLSVRITDNGKGFNPEKLEVSSEHIGITGMKERVKLLSGDFSIVSKRGSGTSIQIDVPYQKSNAGGCSL
jgi:two-component system, NarL family, sensor histidine kinase UhpB